jgi:hypothetical protein
MFSLLSGRSLCQDKGNEKAFPGNIARRFFEGPSGVKVDRRCGATSTLAEHDEKYLLYHMKNGNSSDEPKVLSPAETWAVTLEVWETVFGPSENENAP